MRRFLLKSVRKLSKPPRKSDGHRKMNEASDKEKDTIEENNVVTGPQVPEGVGEKPVVKEEGGTGEGRTEQRKVRSLYQRVQTMSVPEKIQLALKGDKEARGLLLRDSNKLVTTAVIKSPKISESEVQQIARSTNVDGELLRIISQKREWMNKYKTKLGLANNPKTPLDISLKLLTSLRARDLSFLAKSKNVPTVLSKKAKQLSDKRSRR